MSGITITKFPRALLDRKYLFAVLRERKDKRVGAQAIGRSLGKPVAHVLQSARRIANEAEDAVEGRYTGAEKRLCAAFVREWAKHGGVGYVASSDADVEQAMTALEHFAAGRLADGRAKPGGRAPKLTEGEVLEIRARWMERDNLEHALSKGDLAEEYGVSQSTIEHVLTGKYVGRPDEEA